MRALRGVSFSVEAGEVHGLLGENGAGKSTLIKVLTGFHAQNSGQLLIDGQAVRFASPREARAAGVAAVYQEINLIPDRSVAENIFVGRERKRFGILLDRPRMVREAAEILGRFDLPLDPRAKLRTLGLGMQQMVSIVRTVSLGARVVILDEPTSALTTSEVEILFRAVRNLRQSGIGVVFVSHRLSECYALCDRLTVLRDGASVRTAPTAELPRGELIAAMLGSERRERARAQARPIDRGVSADALRVEGLSWRTRVRGVSVEVRPGEIVGLVGLLGAGRTETMKAIFGAEAPDEGTIELEGAPLGTPHQPRHSIRRGLGFLSEDRRTEGIFPLLALSENMTASVLSRLSRRGTIDRGRERSLVERFIRELGVRTSGPSQPIGQLSGGNQQKVLLARCLAADPRVIMLDDPTRGIDVGAKDEVHRVVRGLASEGIGILVTSSEVEELFELCDRLVVLNEGRVTGSVAVAETDPDALMAMLAAEAPPA